MKKTQVFDLKIDNQQKRVFVNITFNKIRYNTIN